MHFNTSSGLWVLTKYVILDYSPLLAKCNWAALLALLANCAFSISSFFSCLTVQRLSSRFISCVSHRSLSRVKCCLRWKIWEEGKEVGSLESLKWWDPRACTSSLWCFPRLFMTILSFPISISKCVSAFVHQLLFVCCTDLLLLF